MSSLKTFPKTRVARKAPSLESTTEDDNFLYCDSDDNDHDNDDVTNAGLSLNIPVLYQCIEMVHGDL